MRRKDLGPIPDRSGTSTSSSKDAKSQLLHRRKAKHANNGKGIKKLAVIGRKDNEVEWNSETHRGWCLKLDWVGPGRNIAQVNSKQTGIAKRDEAIEDSLKLKIQDQRWRRTKCRPLVAKSSLLATLTFPFRRGHRQLLAEDDQYCTRTLVACLVALEVPAAGGASEHEAEAELKQKESRRGGKFPFASVLWSSRMQRGSAEPIASRPWTRLRSPHTEQRSCACGRLWQNHRWARLPKTTELDASSIPCRNTSRSLIGQPVETNLAGVA